MAGLIKSMTTSGIEPIPVCSVVPESSAPRHTPLVYVSRSDLVSWNFIGQRCFVVVNGTNPS